MRIPEAYSSDRLPTNGGILWIDWGRHPRTRSLARSLDVKLVEIRIAGNRSRRYLLGLLCTIRSLRRERPAVVVATNPSIVLGYLLLLLRRLYKFTLVADAHYYGVQAVHDSRLLQLLLDHYNRRVSLVIVTTLNHAQRLGALGARTYVCPDPLPDIPQKRSVQVPDKSVFLICSFDEDEPYLSVFESFEHLQAHGYSLFVSGNYLKVGIEPSRFPWVRFLGFLDEDSYYGYLESCTIAMDLTELEDCLVCGAYEALSLSRPLIVSDTSALRAYFGDACVLTENTRDAIRESVVKAYELRGELSLRAANWASRNRSYMVDRIEALKAELRPAREPLGALRSSG